MPNLTAEYEDRRDGTYKFYFPSKYTSEENQIVKAVVQSHGLTVDSDHQWYKDDLKRRMKAADHNE